MILTFTRDNPTGPDCTLGSLVLGEHQWQTIERPWIPVEGSPAGHPGTSSVPLGTYRLVRHNTPKHPKTFALVNPELGVVHDPAPGMRSDILIHSANFAYQLEGCIAVGKGRRFIGQWQLTESRIALGELLALLPWENDQHELVITL